MSPTSVSQVLLDGQQCDTTPRHSATSWGFSALLRHLGPINKQQRLLALTVEVPWGTASTTLPTVGTLRFPAPTADRP